MNGPVRVSTPGDVHIAVCEWGNPAGREVLFVRGFCQASLAQLVKESP